jgi:hypothetical protein
VRGINLPTRVPDAMLFRAVDPDAVTEPEDEADDAPWGGCGLTFLTARLPNLDGNLAGYCPRSRLQ